jgi:DNA repair exonuclease SbcCD ATPase subunit
MKRFISETQKYLVIAAAISSFVAVPVFAQTTATSTRATRQAQALTNVITRSDKEIQSRIDDLNKMVTRIQGLKNVSSDEKSLAASESATEITSLTTLKTKIDADTDLATTRTDEKSIFTAFRIYALVVPQGNILASADRLNTLSGMLSAIATKLQARIAQAQTAGKDVSTLQKALSDMTAQITDAQSQSQAAKTEVSALSPDQGDKTKMQANQQALKDARSKIKVGTQDLTTARKDANTITKGLKAMHLTTGTSTTTPTSSQ